MFVKQQFESGLNEIAEIAQLLWYKGWAEGSAGNYSIHLGEINFKDNYLFNKGVYKKLHSNHPALANHCLLISSSGSKMRNVAKSPELFTGLLHIAEDGESATFYKHNQNPGNISPTSEIDVHLALYNQAIEQNATVRAILHAHVTEIIAITQSEELTTEESLNNVLKNIHPEFELFIPEGVGYIPFMPSANLHMAKITAEKAKEKSAIIWAKHGMICQGKSLNDAFDLMDIVAKQADIFLKCKGFLSS